MVVREAYFAGGAFLERRVARSRARLVFDFDDAIWLPGVSAANRRFAWLKRPTRVADAVRASQLVLAGNAFLADWARQYNERVAVVPTTIDTDKYQVAARSAWDGPICIGWSGSFSTLPHFETVLPALQRVRERLGERVRFKVIGGPDYRVPELGIEGQPWRLESELADLSDIDIGIMPLPDDEWSRGKCGLKGLQYMALGIPTLMSPVGVNSEIVQDGSNGFLPRTEDEWVERLVTLVEAPELRRSLGLAGRATVEERYSLRAWRERYYRLLAVSTEGKAPIGSQQDAA
jgi:glycosyltransferase involved in cell wall biosynthesis